MGLTFWCRGPPTSTKKETDNAVSVEGTETSMLEDGVANIRVDHYGQLTESRLWMKNVIDAIHEDITSRRRDEKDQISENNKDKESAVSQESKKDPKESAQIKTFMADTKLPVLPIEDKTQVATAKRRMAEKLDEFNEAFKAPEGTSGPYEVGG